MPTIPFAPYAPDISQLDTNVTDKILNVVARADGYGPFGSLQSFTQSLPAACRGFFFARKSDASIAVFAATSTRLYQLNNTTFAWTEVSKGIAAYAAVPSDDNWQFAQFNNFVFAVQVNVVVQVFDISSSTEFADLAGSPPQAGQIAIVNRFVVLSQLLSNATRVQWSDLNNTTQWTAGVGQSDFQDLPDGGLVHGVSGGDYFGIIFQDAAIRIMTYAPGSPVIFEIQRVSKDDGLFAKYSAVTAGDRTFFVSPQGFKVISPGGYPTPIGKERVDRTFFADIDQGALRLLLAATDPTATRVYWAYKSLAGQTDLFDKILCYDWAQDKWTPLEITGEYLANLARPGTTLESLDAIAPGIITISGATNNGSGAIRLTISTTSNAFTDLSIENSVVVYGVTGTTEANGTWPFSIINATHIDLTGSTFSNSYSSGGAIGGSLDGLSFSLDSISVVAVAQLAAIDSSNMLGFFTGDKLEAIMETSEQNGQGTRIFVNGLTPLTDAVNAVCSLGIRNNAQTSVSYTAESAINVQGISPQRIDTRYPRARMRVPSGETWTYARGVEPDFRLTGKR